MAGTDVVCVYVCMYACTTCTSSYCMQLHASVSMYICMYSFMMYVCMHVFMYVCFGVCVCPFMYACFYVCIYACMHAYIHVCIYVCMLHVYDVNTVVYLICVHVSLSLSIQCRNNYILVSKSQVRACELHNRSTNHNKHF